MNNSSLHVGKYIDPMVDFAFKKIFKDSGNKKLLIRPLNEFFDLDITDIEIRESEHLGETKKDRRASFDIYCEASDKSKFIIEVQIAPQTHFQKRALYYSTFPIREQAPRGFLGRRKNWNFNFAPVYFLGLIDFNMPHPEPEKYDPNIFIHKFSIRHEITGERYADSLTLAFCEIARFNKKKEECNTFEDRFLYLFKNLPTFAERPELLWNDPYFDEFLEVAEFVSMTPEEKRKYNEDLKMRYDYDNTIAYAKEQGFKQGVESGIKQGVEQNQESTAKKMLAKGYDVSEISELTSLSPEEINNL